MDRRRVGGVRDKEHDEEHCFALNLEKLALKKSSNNEVFSYIKKLFDKALNEKEFQTVNESKNFSLKDGTTTKYDKLDMYVN